MSGKSGAVRAGVVGALGINAVPMAGALAGRWPPATTMVVYLAETLLLVMIIVLRLRLLAPERLQVQGVHMQSRDECVQGFLLLCGGFTTVLSIINGFILARAADLDLATTLRALASSLPVFLAIELLILLADVVLLRQATQPQVEGWIVRGMRRAVVLFFALFLGMAATIFDVGWYVWPFIMLKLLMDVGITLEQALGIVQRAPSALRR